MALAALLDLQELGGDAFRGVNTPEGTYWPRVFGGQLVAQALVAACRTVEPTLACHSLHAYFLAPGDTGVDFTYRVTRLREGRSFAARRVAAEQSGVCIFEMLASFQRPESSAFVRQQPAPGRLAGVRAPERLATQAALLRLRAADVRLPAPLRAKLAARAECPFPLDVRLSRPRAAPDARQQAWLRCPEALSDDPALHLAAAAYGSDFALLDTATLPHKQAGDGPGRFRLASLDHAVWFHRPLRADQWLLYDMESPTATGGRAMAFGRLFDSNGVLVASVAQEGLLRAAPQRGCGPDDQPAAEAAAGAAPPRARL